MQAGKFIFRADLIDFSERCGMIRFHLAQNVLNLLLAIKVIAIALVFYAGSANELSVRSEHQSDAFLCFILRKIPQKELWNEMLFLFLCHQ
jgi:hypothetical protein